MDDNNKKLSYSSPLKEIVRNLCTYDHDLREKSTEIFALLQPHKEAILNIEPFELHYKNQRASILNNEETVHMMIGQTFVNPL